MTWITPKYDYTMAHTGTPGHIAWNLGRLPAVHTVAYGGTSDFELKFIDRPGICLIVSYSVAKAAALYQQAYTDLYNHVREFLRWCENGHNKKARVHFRPSAWKNTMHMTLSFIHEKPVFNAKDRRLLRRLRQKARR